MEPKLQKGKFNKFFWTAPNRGLVEILNEDYKKDSYFQSEERQSKILQTIINNELNFSDKFSLSQNKSPKHIEYMKTQDLVGYCDVSEKGHMKWFPKGVFVQRLFLDYARTLAHEWGAFEMKNPIILKGDNNTIGELMGEFHEENYKVDGGRGTCYLRYASDPLGFPFMQQVRISENQTPLKVYEEASCFRNEQEGAVSGLKRVRNFLMTDMHAACVNENQAKYEFKYLTKRFGRLMDEIIAKERWALAWEGTVDFFDKNKDWLKELSDSMNVPALYKLMPEMSHYYAIKNEFQSILQDGSNIQISTVQWDVKDGPRFGINYMGSDGLKHPFPVILHASSFGSIERTLCAILENIAIDESEGKVPKYPLWLSPTQIRIIPVNDNHIPFAEELTKYFSNLNVRTDIDDRGESVGKRIRNASQEWVPYTLVVGDNELNDNQLQVRERGIKEIYSTTPNDLVDKIHLQTKDMPYSPLPLPKMVSMRPLFK
jgi:threonyl-tRNA synthetase